MTLELVPWRGAQVPLLQQGEIARYDVAGLINLINANQGGYGGYMGPPMPVTTYGKNPVEPISNSFEGFVYGMLYVDGPVAAVEAYRLRVFGQAPLLYQEIVDGRAGDLFDDPALDRLRAPWAGATLSDLMKRALIYGDFAGNAFIADLENELVLLRPDWVEIVLEKRMFRGQQLGWRQLGIVYYEGGVGRGADGVPFLPGEYAHFIPGLPDPLATYRGMSWLTPLVRDVQSDKAAMDHKVAFFENSASPNLAVSLPKEVSPKQFDEFVELMDSKHKGPRNAGKTLYTGGGADVTVIGANMQQQDFAAVVGKSETRIANAGGVSPVLLSFSEGMQGSSLNAGNYTPAKRNFVDTTMRDLWANFAGSVGQMDAFKAPRDHSRLWYDGRDIPFLHEDLKDLADIQQTRASTLSSYVTNGWKPESAIKAVAQDDITLLVHSGAFSVQLQPPGAEAQMAPDTNGNGLADDLPPSDGAPEPDFGALRADFWEFDEEDVLRAVEDLFGVDEDDLERARYDVRVDPGHVGGGRFRKLSDIAAALLSDWAKGDGEDDPLDRFDPPQLRRILADQRKKAVEAGDDARVGRLTPRRGATETQLKDALYNDVRGAVRQDRDTRERLSAKFTLQGRDHRDLDVAVYKDKDGKPGLFREGENGKRGALVEKFDSLDEMRAWANEHGEPRLADWARKESGPKASAAKKAAKAPAPGMEDDVKAGLAATIQHAGKDSLRTTLGSRATRRASDDLGIRSQKDPEEVVADLRGAADDLERAKEADLRRWFPNDKVPSVEVREGDARVLRQLANQLEAAIGSDEAAKPARKAAPRKSAPRSTAPDPDALDARLRDAKPEDRRAILEEAATNQTQARRLASQLGVKGVSKLSRDEALDRVEAHYAIDARPDDVAHLRPGRSGDLDAELEMDNAIRKAFRDAPKDADGGVSVQAVAASLLDANGSGYRLDFVEEGLRRMTADGYDGPGRPHVRDGVLYLDDPSPRSASPAKRAPSPAARKATPRKLTQARVDALDDVALAQALADGTVSPVVAARRYRLLAHQVRSAIAIKKGVELEHPVPATDDRPDVAAMLRKAAELEAIANGLDPDPAPTVASTARPGRTGPRPARPARPAGKIRTAAQAAALNEDDLALALGEGRITSGLAARQYRSLATSARTAASIKKAPTWGSMGQSTDDRADIAALLSHAEQLEALADGLDGPRKATPKVSIPDGPSGKPPNIRTKAGRSAVIAAAVDATLAGTEQNLELDFRLGRGHGTNREVLEGMREEALTGKLSDLEEFERVLGSLATRIGGNPHDRPVHDVPDSADHERFRGQKQEALDAVGRALQVLADVRAGRPLPPARRASGNDAFQFSTNGLTATLDRPPAPDVDGKIRAEGQVRDSSGTIVGSFGWHLDPATHTAHMDSVGMAPEHQGRGFTSQFTAHVEDQLRQQGYTRFTVDAAYGGGSFWARRGYGWDPNSITAFGDVPARMVQRLARDPNGPDAPQLQRWLDRFGSDDRADWPSPREIVDSGPLGESVMDGASWKGEKSLGPSGDVVSNPDGVDLTGLPSGADIEVASSLKELSDLQLKRGENLTSAGRRALDALGPAGHPRIAAIPDTEGKIREGYRMLALPGGGSDSYVAIADLRKLIGEQVSRGEVDAALKQMDRAPDARLVPQSYGRENAATRIPAAVMVGGQEQNLLYIADPTLARPRQFGAVSMAEELVNRRDGGTRNPLMASISDADLRAEVDRRIADPITARDVASEVPSYGRATSAPRRTASSDGLDAMEGTRPPSVPDLTGSRGLSSDPAIREVQIENRIRQAYRDALAAGDRGYNGRPAQDGFVPGVRLSAVRDRIGADIPRGEVDDALRRLAADQDVHLGLDENQQTLTEADRAATVRVGMRDVTMISINKGDARSPRPLPSVPSPEDRRPSTGRYSDAPVKPNMWGGSGGLEGPVDPDTVNFHPGHAVGAALKALGPEGRLAVDGQPLANRIGDIATAWVHGEITGDEAVTRFAHLRDRLADGPAKRALANLVTDIDSPARGPVDLPAATPAPIRDLVEKLRANPLARRTEAPRGQAAREPLIDRVEAWAQRHFAQPGVMSVQANDELLKLQTSFHGGTEGMTSIERDVQLAARELKELRAAQIAARSSGTPVPTGAPEAGGGAPQVSSAPWRSGLDQRADHLRRYASQTPARVRPLSGSTSESRIREYADGTKLVHKDQQGATSEDPIALTDAEELAPLVLGAVGLRPAAVARTGPTSIDMEWVDGTDAVGVLDDQRDTDEGRLLGLADSLMFNTDRGINWRRRPDGTLAGIDNGAAFQDYGNEVPMGANPFAQHFVRPGRSGADDAWAPANDMSPADMRQIRQQLETLRPDFDRLGRRDWYDAMIGRFDVLAAAARGKRSRTGARPSSRTPAESAARTRQADIDSARRVADVISEIQELRGNQAGPEVMRRTIGARAQRDPSPDLQPILDAVDTADPARIDTAIREAAQRHGLTPVGAVGEVGFFDPKRHQMVSGSRPAEGSGVQVRILRPGYSYSRDGEQVSLSKAVVEVDGPEAVPSPVDFLARFSAGREAGLSAEDAQAFAASGLSLEQWRAQRSGQFDEDDIERAEDYEDNSDDESDDDDDPDLDDIMAMAADDDASRAAGHDTTPGNDELHHWWTKGPGAARWVDSPTPWRTLLANLVEAVKDKPLETLKKWTSRWYIEVFGYAAGSDKARVAHGKPPRGNVVGPG